MNRGAKRQREEKKKKVVDRMRSIGRPADGEGVGKRGEMDDW